MCEITIRGHVTTFDAFKYILKFNIIILRNAWRGLDKLVHRFPWLCMLAIIVISFLVCFVEISKARAERDSYNKKNVQLSEKVASYEAAFSK